MSFGERLQALRRSNDLTQEAFAEQLKVSRQAVSKWESSRGYPEMEKIIYICNRFGVSMNELFLDEVPPPKHSEEAAERNLPAKQPLKSLSLKNSFGNFFSNLSPATSLPSAPFWRSLRWHWSFCSVPPCRKERHTPCIGNSSGWRC